MVFFWRLGKQTCFITRLPDEILVEEIMVKLSIEDVVTLRRVNKLFYQLTHQPIIWKTFLRSMNITPPPLPPSKRYSHLGSITGFEAERMVTRAISFHNNWRSEPPKVYDIRHFILHHNVLSMVVLPGGKHLVASVADYTYKVYSLMVFVMDYRHGGLVPLAKTPTETKAQNLRAKYMTVRGVSGIVIAYVRREFYGSSHVSSGTIDPSDYAEANDIDPPSPLRYECMGLLVSLETLEDLADPKFPPGSVEFLERAKAQPPPFWRLSRIRSRSQLDTIDLADMRGVPYIAIVKKPETIIFKNLDTGTTSSLTIKRWQGFENVEHNIHNFRIMPYHRDLLIMVSFPIVTPVEYPSQDLALPSPPVVSGPRKKEAFLYACIFTIPNDGDDVRDVEPFESKFFEDGTDFENIQISDPVLPSRLDRSIRPLSFQAADPPVCIYYRNLSTQHLMEARIRPCRPDPLQPLRNTFFESLTTLWRTSYQIEGRPGGVIANVLPAHTRPLIWTTVQANRTHSPPLSNFYSHIHDVQGEEGKKEWELEEDSVDMDEALEDEDQPTLVYFRRKQARSANSASIAIPVALRKTLKFGIKGLAWDDWTGRIFVATLDDCMIHVIDLGQSPKEDSRGQRMPVPLADDRMIDR